MPLICDASCCYPQPAGVGGWGLIVVISFIQCHLSIHVLPSSFIYCYDLKSSVFSLDKMANQLMNIDIILKKMIQQDQISLLAFPFALLGHPHLSHHIHPVNEVIHRGTGINTLSESKCAFISNPKNDKFSLTVRIPKINS